MVLMMTCVRLTIEQAPRWRLGSMLQIVVLYVFTLFFILYLAFKLLGADLLVLNSVGMCC